VFANYHSNLNSDKVNELDEAMELTRAYLGYKAKISEYFSAKIVMDVTNSSGKYDTYLKNAELGFKKGKLALNMGLISTSQFKVQEKFWGYRYLRKSFQDQYKYNSSADVGISASYELNKIFSVDAIVQNGEGYKNIDPTHTYRGGIGATIKYEPIIFRLYYDVSAKTDISRHNISSFIAYSYKKKFRIGAEYNYQLNNSFIENYNMFGYSIYSTYVINPKFEVFARYDNSMSNVVEGPNYRPDIEPQAWNVNRDEQAAIIGLQYQPVKRVKIAANYRRTLSALKDSEGVDWVYVNLEFKF
jgi:hypothetical protein